MTVFCLQYINQTFHYLTVAVKKIVLGGGGEVVRTHGQKLVFSDGRKIEYRYQRSIFRNIVISLNA